MRVAEQHKVNNKDALEVDNVATGPEWKGLAVGCWWFLRRHHTNQEDENSLVHGIEVPRPEYLRIEEATLNSGLVELRIGQELLFSVLNVHHAPVKQDSARESHIVKLIHNLFK